MSAAPRLISGRSCRYVNRAPAGPLEGIHCAGSKSYDHWARDEPEYIRIAVHIESNPVKAGLAGHAGDYPWSSANPDQRLDTIVEAADTSVRATPGNLQRGKRVALGCQPSPHESNIITRSKT
jgi:hypothetical protein